MNGAVGRDMIGNTAKFAGFLSGAAVGIGLATSARHCLPSPQVEEGLERKGVSTLSHLEATIMLASTALVTSAAVGTGISRRSGSAAFTTASLGAAAMLASTGASAMINADRDTADEYVRTLGLMSGVAAAGFAVGAVDQVPLKFAKISGLTLLGVAAGGLLPETARFLGQLPSEVKRSYQYRHGG